MLTCSVIHFQYIITIDFLMCLELVCRGKGEQKRLRVKVSKKLNYEFFWRGWGGARDNDWPETDIKIKSQLCNLSEPLF